MYVVAVTNCNIGAVCVLLLNVEKEVQMWISIYLTEQVLTILNGCVHHAIDNLSKNKVPPYAVVNGMQFPPKPAFFCI